VITEMNIYARVGDEVRGPGSSVAVTGKAGPPADFVYDSGQIILELLRGRAEEEDRRRFVEALRRLRGAAGLTEEL
jgi:hypothetical protein